MVVRSLGGKPHLNHLSSCLIEKSSWSTKENYHMMNRICNDLFEIPIIFVHGDTSIQ